MAMTTTAMFVTSMVISAVGAVAQASAQASAGRAAKRAADARAASLDHQAAQARVKGIQEVAVAQRAALAKKREGEFISSRALALAAKSGAGVSDPTVENLLGDIGAEGEFRALSELFIGKQRQHDLNTMADLRMFEGAQERIGGSFAQSAGRAAATITLVKGAASIGMSAAKSGIFKTAPSTSLTGFNNSAFSSYTPRPSYG